MGMVPSDRRPKTQDPKSLGFYGTCTIGQPFLRTEPLLYSGSTYSRAVTGKCQGFNEVFRSSYFEQVCFEDY